MQTKAKKKARFIRLTSTVDVDYNVFKKTPEEKKAVKELKKNAVINSGFYSRLQF